ncbi:hypothetical protein [Pusillimonas sp. ANT_WB101]|uniref:hypothetical protein n=1 Tax=Pusillimonas sp. ANT_WB101 TaxID=2597356 RepID=UPI0011EDB0AC|nr:hypothetical protein [Pusillimonas sp. ANT_WB101]KAA0910912.1 hypothetical protein FQ179_03355 [Pusillimonas sp. ANT_WB101]
MAPHTHRYLSIASVVILTTVFLPEVSSAAANKNFKMECSQDEQVFSSAHGQFRLDICSPTADAVTPATETDTENPVLGEQRFISGEATNTVTTAWPFEVDMLSAWVGGEGLQFWDGHIMTLDIGTERNGILYIANWTGKTFVMTEYPYRTGDEDTMTLRWEKDAFLIHTPSDGERRLVVQNTDTETPGKFSQETAACTFTDDNQAIHSLALGIDTAGLVTKLAYTALRPATLGDSRFLCGVYASRDDNLQDESEWTDGQHGNLTVAINGEGTVARVIT